MTSNMRSFAKIDTVAYLSLFGGVGQRRSTWLSRLLQLTCNRHKCRQWLLECGTKNAFSRPYLLSIEFEHLQPALTL
jgi:hypothetical protein